jgi:glyoxylase-like metal-dependent hydrolase (beta-lactamase superfamily II)
VDRPGRLYPRPIEPDSPVFDLGYTSPDSFGASACFVRRNGGNLLIDSPRFVATLERAIDDMGGIADILLTHQDDVADAARWQERFGARVWIHAADRRAAPTATNIINGVEDVEVRPGVIAVPVPGHTRGSVVFVIDEQYCFSGDSLAWSHDDADLMAFRDACWYSWPEQQKSLARLADAHRFTWLLPGHGARVRLDPDEMHRRLLGLVVRMT